MFAFLSLNNIPKHVRESTSTSPSPNRTQFDASIAARNANNASQNQPDPSFEKTMQAYQLYLRDRMIKNNEMIIGNKGGALNKAIENRPFDYDKIKQDITPERFIATMRVQDKIMNGQQQIIDELSNREKKR